MDTAGAKITATYNDGTTQTVDVTSAMVGGFNTNTTGQQTITVTYQGKTTTFTVIVSPTAVPTAVSTVAPTTAPSYQKDVKATASRSTLYVNGNTGSTTTIKTTVPAGAVIANITYSSSNTAKTMINTSGKVTAKKAGKVIINTKVTLTNGEVATLTSRIKIKNAYISFAKKTSSVKKGKKYTFSAEAYGSSMKITWKVSNAKIGSITTSGKFTAKKKGRVKIIVSSGSIKTTYTVKVK